MRGQNNESPLMPSFTFPDPQIIETNGISLEVFAAGEGKPLVLCHGWPEHAFSWRYQIQPLVDAGYHVIVPNQRGYGRSSQPADVDDYDIKHLSADLLGLLDHYGYEDAVFVGHDWGAIVVWGLTLLHPGRVKGLINLSVPYLERGPKPWVEFWEEMLGQDFYIVHFNRQPGVAAAVMDEYARQFLTNLYRKNVPATDPGPGMAFINLAKRQDPLGEPIMSDDELNVFVESFEHSGFNAPINWYRNFDRNWQLLADADPIVKQPALMIYGAKDAVPQMENLKDLVPNVESHVLDCGHWIQQERPDETNELMLNWLKNNYSA